jgi:hypothetical protein
MKKILSILALVALPLSAFCEQGLYIQLQGNKVFPMDAKASGTVEGNTINGDVEYDDSFTPGIEIGMKGIGDTNFRAGIQFMQPEFEFNKASGTTTLSRSDLTRQEILDADAKMLMINGYYDFAGHWESFVPFVGLGVGMVDFDRASDKEAAAAVMLGFKKYVTDSKQLYIGHKSSFTRAKAPKVSGVSFDDDIDFYTATFQLGYEF